MQYSGVLSDRAGKELRSSFIWYEQQQKGLGIKFIEDVDIRIAKIVQNPELYSIKQKSY